MFKVNTDAKRLMTNYSLENVTTSKQSAGLKLPKIDATYTSMATTNTAMTEDSSPPSVASHYQATKYQT